MKSNISERIIFYIILHFNLRQLFGCIEFRKQNMTKNIIAILIIMSLNISCQSQKSAFSEEALNSNLQALDGKEVAFKEIINKNRGKTLVIEIWASWCGDCVKAMAKLKKLQQDNPDVSYVFISMDKAEDKWKSGIEKHEIKGDHFWATEGMKGSFGKSIDLDWIPRYIIIDKKDKVVLYRAIETDFEKIDTTIKTLK